MHVNDRPPRRPAPGAPDMDLLSEPNDGDVPRQQAEPAVAHQLDRMRIDDLAHRGFAGVAYEQFRSELWAYAWPVLLAGLREGTIFAECGKAGIAINPTPDERRVLHSSSADREEIALETIANALGFFHAKVLGKNKWSSTGGASIRTYFIGACKIFIGACKIQLRDVYRRWSRERADRLAPLGYGLDGDEVAWGLADDLSVDPADIAATADTLRRIMSVATPEAMMMCALTLEDMPQAEIGHELGISERAVEGHMRRLRKRAEKLADRGVISVPAPLRPRRSARRAA